MSATPPTPLDKPTVRRLTRTFDPYRNLYPEETDTLYVARSNGPLQRIFSQIQSTDNLSQLRIALVGARGSGKSSELRRLTALLARETQGDTLPIFVDIAAELPAHASTAAWLPIVAAAVRAARIDWGEPVTNPPPTGLDLLGISASLFESLVGSLGAAGTILPLAKLGLPSVVGPTTTEVAIETAGVALSAAASLAQGALGIVREVTHAAQTSAKRGPTLKPVIEGLQSELSALAAASGRRICLLLDGLDKRSTLDEVFEALDDAALLHDLPCGVILTGPVQLASDPRFAAHDIPGHFAPEYLQTLQVVDRAGNPHRAGADVLRMIAERRWAEATHQPLLISTAQLGQLATWSGGIPRTFLSLLKDSVTHLFATGTTELTEVDLETIVRPHRLRMERTLDERRVKVLFRVLERGLPPETEDAELVMNNLVLIHANGETWHRPHELLVPFLTNWKRRQDQREQGDAEGGLDP